MSLEGYFITTEDSGQSQLYELFEKGSVEDFVIEFPPATNTSWKFKGVVTGYSTSAALEDPISFSCKIKVSGKPTLTVGQQTQ